MKLENLNLVDLNDHEMKVTDGGFWPAVLAGAGVALTVIWVADEVYDAYKGFNSGYNQRPCK